VLAKAHLVVGIEPGWMRRAIIVDEPLYCLREDLDLPARRPERVSVRVGAKVSEHDVRLGRRVDTKPARAFQLVERRQFYAYRGRLLA
jgi:hypothetical protein